MKNNLKSIVLKFQEKYENYTEEPYYIIWGNCLKLAKDLEQVPMWEIEQRMEFFFTESWFADEVTKLTFPAFVKNFNQFNNKTEMITKKYKKLLEE